MRFLRCLMLVVSLLSAAVAFAQKEDFLPLNAPEMQIKAVPNEPAAPAIQLYYADFIDDINGSEFFHVCIRILNDKGVSYADVELLVPPDTKLDELKARTIHPDGKIIEFTGKPFQKTLIKGRGIKFLAKTFTMPEVTAGSIIEYKYRLYMPDHTISARNEWTIQHDLYTVKEQFRMRPYQGMMQTSKGEDRAQISAVYSRMPQGLQPKLKGDIYEMEAHDIPAFESEEYMPPAETYKPHVRFFYGFREVASPDKFWEDLGRDIHNQVEHFIGNSGEVKQATQQAISDETEPGMKLRRIYEYVQKVRNLTNERDRTEQELKKENLKSNNNAADVLKHGYGYRSQITRLFAAMARAAGFQASILEVSNRSEKFFDKGVLSQRELDTEIVMVNVNGTDMYLDPGTKFCPYGLVRWAHTSTAALRLDSKGGAFIIIPPATQDKAVTTRTANMGLTEYGSLKGTISVQFKGTEALERRLSAWQTDEAGRAKELEDEMKQWLPSTAIVKLASSQAWEGTDEPLVVQFSVEIPSYAAAAGKRLLIPGYLFQSKQMDAFKHAERKYPVYFPYAFSEIDKVYIKFPAGYSPESAPQAQAASLPYARYTNGSSFDGSQLNIQRVLLVNGIFFDTKVYDEVKDFFKKVRTADEQQAVLQSKATTAQKGN